MILLRLWFRNRWWWYQEILVPVNVTISTGIHKRKKIVYYRLEKHKHRRHH